MSDKLNGGGPAFPFAEYHPGMSLRDWFAGLALAGFWANSDECVIDVAGEFDVCADTCYQMAEAMLAARKAKAEGASE
jgi:apolipoprotein N-acyltransferase